MIDYAKYKWLDVTVELSPEALAKEKEVQHLLDTLDKKDYLAGKKNILASYYIDQCNKYASEDRLDQIKLDSSLTKSFRTWPKSQSFKKLSDQIIQNEKGKFIMSGIVIVMTGTLILFFLMAVLTEKFLFKTIWIDGIVGALAIVFFYRNMKIKYKTIKRYTDSKDFLYLDIASIVLSILLKMWLPVSFDFSLIILFIAHYVSKKKFDKILDGFEI